MTLERLIKSGTFTMSIRIAVPEPIAANFNCASTILTETLPSGFIASDSCVLYRLNHFEKTKGLACKHFGEGHNMNMGEILGWSGGTLLLLMTFVQVAPIKVNPWSWLAKKIGRAINGEVLNEIADIKKEQRETQDKLEKHIQDDDERDASMHRQRILRFNIELMRGEDFTHECFNDMLLDIDEYERFCETHPGYKNNRAVMAIANIKRVYQDHEENGGFLV